MPVYTYRCTSCGTELDHQQSFNDPPLSLCPNCHQNQMQRVYKPIRVVFKGSGFYATDHRSPSGTGNGQASKSAEGEKSTSKSSESSPNGTVSQPTSTEKIS